MKLKDLVTAVGKSGNSVIDQFNILIDKYKEFLSTLSVEQYGPLINILGLICITACLISLGTILYGDYLIKYFNIEAKYPKIAKFIQLRRKFQ